MSESAVQSSGSGVRIVHGAEQVRRTLLARSPELVTIDESAVAAASSVFGERLTPTAFVERVIREVRDEGDDAVRRIAAALGDHVGTSFEIGSAELADASRRIDPELRGDIELAAERIRDYHEREMPAGFELPGLGAGQQWIPVDRAGLHVPGQAAPLVSSLLMAAVPARVAGVGGTGVFVGVSVGIGVFVGVFVGGGMGVFVGGTGVSVGGAGVFVGGFNCRRASTTGFQRLGL